jgi:hypothetical protein
VGFIGPCIWKRAWVRLDLAMTGAGDPFILQHLCHSSSHLSLHVGFVLSICTRFPHMLGSAGLQALQTLFSSVTTEEKESSIKLQPKIS